MREEDVKRFNEFLLEFQNESDRGAALVGAAMIDTTLADTLESFMVRGKIADKLLHRATAPLQSLAARINANFALGLINGHEREECNATRRIRNEFAHGGIGASFTAPKIAELCDGLKSNLPGDCSDFAGKPRQIFINAVILIYLALHYRAEWVKRERRITKNWPY